MKKNLKLVVTLFVMLTLMMSYASPAFAEDSQGGVVTGDDGQRYEYVVNSWHITEEASKNSRVENPLVCGNSIGIGQSRSVTFKQSYETTNKITYDSALKLSKGLNIPLAANTITASMQKELNFKIGGERSSTYTQSIEVTETIKFSDNMEQKGYNTCIPYSGIVYNTLSVNVTVYKVHKYTYRNWFLGRKHTAYKRDSIVGTTTISSKQPLLIVFVKYMTVSLDGSVSFDPNFSLSGTDTIRLK